MEFDAESLFDTDYLHLHREALDARAAYEVDLIWRLLDLRPGVEVLDLACGHGRLAEPLAARGCRVTGLDSSEHFLEVARRAGRADYVLGDMRELPWRERFDVVINWFTAFGYFSDEENQRVLGEVHRVLRPGGKLALELNNATNLLGRFQPESVDEVDGVLQVDRRSLDPVSLRIRTERSITREGRTRRIPFAVRLFTAPELRDRLLRAGFTAADFRGEDGEPLTHHHRRMITTTTRAA